MKVSIDKGDKKDMVSEFKYFIEIYKIEFGKKLCFVDGFTVNSMNQSMREIYSRIGTRYKDDYLIKIKDKDFNNYKIFEMKPPQKVEPKKTILKDEEVPDSILKNMKYRGRGADKSEIFHIPMSSSSGNYNFIYMEYYRKALKKTVKQIISELTLGVSRRLRTINSTKLEDVVDSPFFASRVDVLEKKLNKKLDLKSVKEIISEYLNGGYNE